MRHVIPLDQSSSSSSASSLWSVARSSGEESALTCIYATKEQQQGRKNHVKCQNQTQKNKKNAHAVFRSYLRVYNDTSHARSQGVGTGINIDHSCCSIKSSIKIRHASGGSVGGRVQICFDICDTSRAHIRGSGSGGGNVSNDGNVVVCSHCVCNSLSGTNLP